MTESPLSASALLVSKGLVFLSRDPKLHSLVPTDSADMLLHFIRQVTGNPHYGNHLTFPPYRWLVRTLVKLAYPGMILNYALRKRVIEQTAVEPIEQGTKQLVIIGAGFDTLALRLARRFPPLHCFEIDKPETQNVKRRIAEVAPFSAPVTFLPADLSVKKLSDVLRSNPVFDPAARSVFVLEGVSMYLSPQNVADLFRDIRSIAGPGSLFVFTFMDSRGKDRLLSRLWQKKHERMEGFALTPGEMGPYLHSFDMKLRAVHLFQQMQKPYVNAHEMALLERTRGEHVAVAEIA